MKITKKNIFYPMSYSVLFIVISWRFGMYIITRFNSKEESSLHDNRFLRLHKLDLPCCFDH